MTSDTETPTATVGTVVHRSGYTLRKGNDDDSLHNPTGDQPLYYGVLGPNLQSDGIRKYGGAENDMVLISYDPKKSTRRKSFYKTWAVRSSDTGDVRALCRDDPNQKLYEKIIAAARSQDGDAALCGTVKASWCSS